MFSEVPELASAESSFTLTEDGLMLSGDFSWLGPELTFRPYGGLRPNAEYRLVVSADARNVSGVSLGQSFEVGFSSKSEVIRPVVLSTLPLRDGILETSHDLIRLTFSEAVDAVSLIDCISFSPANKGTWEQESGGSVAVFTPLELWTWGTEYKVSISADLVDTSGNRLGKPFLFGFTVGVDRASPVLLGAEALDEDGLPVAIIRTDTLQDGLVLENPGWEASWKLRLHYSEPVVLSSLDSIVGVGSGVSIMAEWAGAIAQTIDFRITGYPEWGQDFMVRVPSGVKDEAGNASLVESVFRFIYDGPRSRPPRFVGIRLPLSPGEPLPEDRNLAVFSVAQPYETIAMTGDSTGYPIGIPVATSIEVYVELATGSGVNYISLMKSFRFSSTNGALDFSANRILAEGLTYAEPYNPWVDYTVVRIDGTITNRIESGILTLQLTAGFCDSSGNASSSAQSLPLLK